ncbi:ATP-binding cassette domain-containing protein [Vreelandella sp. TE19]
MLTLHQAGLTTTPALAPLTDTLVPGELVAVVGPNGAGKSTLLKLLSGFRLCEQGSVTLDGIALERWSITRLARRRAMVAQQEHPAFDWPVAELVALGSAPSSALLATLLEDMDLSTLAKRSVLSLSGGERQRVMIARGACQLLSKLPTDASTGAVLLLDEPTSALDIGHQQRLMRRLRSWAADYHLAVVCVLHDLKLATIFADRVWLMHEGERIASGSPQDVLDPETVARVYEADLNVERRPGAAPSWTLAR